MPPDSVRPLTQRRRRPRLTSGKVKELMFEAARDAVSQLGLSASLEDLSLEDVIVAAGVTRSSVYRIWPYRGDFVGDLLVEMAKPDWYGTAAFDSETARVATKVLYENWDLLGSEDGRHRLMLEMVRVGARRNFDFISHSDHWRVYIALLATARATRDERTRNRVASALRQSEATFIQRMAAFYRAMAEVMGFRLRNRTLTFEQLAAVGAAVVEGLALRHILSLTKTTDPTSKEAEDLLQSLLMSVEWSEPNLSSPDWSLASLGFMGVLTAFVELVPQNEYEEPTDAQLNRIVESLKNQGLDLT